jgi:hypothetical protein
MKLGLIYAVSAGRQNRVVEQEDLISADTILIETEKCMPAVIDLIMSTNQGEMMNVIYRKILLDGQTTKTRLVQTFSHRLANKELSEYLDTLIQAKRIVCVREDGETIFRPVDQERLSV